MQLCTSPTEITRLQGDKRKKDKQQNESDNVMLAFKL